MRTWRLAFGLLTVASFACTGGQSGTEEAIPACAHDSTRAIELDQETLAGTPRALFESVVALAAETVALRWYSPDGSGAYADTTVTLSVSGVPTSATLMADPEEGCPQIIEVEGAMLRLQTADGAFDEIIPGYVYNSTDYGRTFGDHHYKLNFYGGQWSTTFASIYPNLNAMNSGGSYDLSAVARQFMRPQMYFATSLSPANGYLSANSDAKSGVYQKSVTIAAWGTSVVHSAAGAAGSSGG